jgi:tetratricopeptide (TPR) repeat protein
MQTDPPETRQPESRDALYRLAASQRREGRIADAIETLKRLEKLYPPFGGMFEELGLCFLVANVPAKAILAFERAVALNMCLSESWRALDALYRAIGRSADAQSAAAHVAQLASLPAEIRSACSRYFDGERVVAEDLVRGYLATHGDHVEALRLLAKIAADAGVDHDAELLLQRAVTLAPQHEAARHELAIVLLKREKHAQAREQIDRLLTISPNHRPYRTLRAAAAVELGDYRKALPLYAELLQEAPRDPDLYLAIGNALRATGKTQEAIDSYRFATEIKPGLGEAFWALASLGASEFTDAQIAHMRQQEANPDTTPADRHHFCFALGKALEDRGDFAASYEYYERGNALKRASSRFRLQALERTARQQVFLCTREFFESRRTYGYDSRSPVFIVGLPESGSTLIGKILGAHSRVDALPELGNVPRLVQELQAGEHAGKLGGYPGLLGALSAEVCQRLGEHYVRDTAPYRSSKAGAPRPCFVDTMPNNFRHLGLLQLILPNAKVLDVRRDPMACGCDIFKQLFASGQRFAYSLEDIARYYRMYVQLMAHWERVLPGKILRVQYEDLVKEPESGVRRILDFCSLDFEPTCVEPARSPRKELDHWRHFERWLEPLRRNLALEQHV